MPARTPIIRRTLLSGIQTVSFQPDDTTGFDTFLQEALPTNVATTAVNLSVNGAAGSRRNALLKFDLSSFVGKRIMRARLYLCNITTSASNATFSFHAILAANSAWVEAANWDYAVPSTTRWAGDTGADGLTDAGCSVADTDYSSAPLGGLEYVANTVADTQHTVELGLAQMQAMVSANYGIVMRRAATGVFSFHSSSSATPAFRPQLSIEYAG